MLTFVEDERFTRAANRLLTDDDLLRLMLKLAKRPTAGVVMPNSDGCRKLRFPAKGKGSRGGARVIYFCRLQTGQILLLDVYAKNDKENLSAKDLALLRAKLKQ